jgi:hypothetical protein
MVIKISKKSKKEDLDKALRKMSTKRKKLDLNKYFGKVSFGIDGLAYQKKIRNEWT